MAQVDLGGAKFGAAAVARANFITSRAWDSSFNHADLSYVIVEDCDFTRASLQHADVTGADFFAATAWARRSSPVLIMRTRGGLPARSIR